MLHNPSLNERSECRLGVLMTARLAEDVPRRGTIREARNDGAPSCYASKMHSASLRGWQEVHDHPLTVPSLRSLRSLRLGL